jgi:Leucine-rich repeat (LRR) protein
LDLSSNNLTNIPSLDKYPMLEKVALRNCSSIEEYEFPQMPSIKSIDLSNNGFNLQKNFVLDNLLLLPNVQEVDLSNNNMIYFPKASSKVAELNKQTFFDGITYLNVNNNRIDDLYGIEKFISLNKLIISSNKLWTLNGIQHSPQIKYLNLSQNEFLTDIKAIQNLTSLQTLKMEGCLRVQNWEYLKSLTQLQILSLSGCGLKKIYFLNSHNQLTSLDCSDNNLTEISFLFQLQNLTELNLSGNKIENLTPLLSLKKLKRLIMHKVTSPEEITKLQKMLPHTEIVSDIIGNEIIDSRIVDAVMPATTNNNGQ